MEEKGSLAEQVYVDVKGEVCSGDILPGARVHIAEICARYCVSKSPVRDALHRLVGEGLLELRAHDGFYRPRLSQQSTGELFDWSETVLLLSLDMAEAKGSPVTANSSIEIDPNDNVVSIERIFEAIAKLSGHSEHLRDIRSLNDRLRALRRVKPKTLIDREHELTELLDAWSSKDLGRLRTQIISYHAQRVAVLPSMVLAAYSEAPAPRTL